MNGYLAFVKKEFTESFRTSKAIILFAVFLLFGIMSPLSAKMLPEIFAGLEVEGMVIQLPEPVALDSYGQLFKNLTQMGIVVFLLVFGGMLSGEISRGTLVNMLSKGLSKNAVILSKFTVSVLLWTMVLGVASATTYGYTVYLFPGETVNNLLFSIFCLWLFGAFLLALLLLSSTVVKGNLGGLALTAGVLGVLMILGAFPVLANRIPVALASKNVALLTGDVTIQSMLPLIGITLALTVLCLLLALAAFKKRAL